MDIKYTYNIFNHISEQVLRQTCIENHIKMIGKSHSCPGCLYAKDKGKRILKSTRTRIREVSARLFIYTSGAYLWCVCKLDTTFFFTSKF